MIRRPPRSTLFPTRRSSDLDRTAEPGYYIVEVRSGKAEHGRPVTAGFAVNLAPEESELKPLTEKEVRALLRSEEHTSELQSPCNLVCRLLLEKKKKNR